MEFKSAREEMEHFKSVENLLHLCAIRMEQRAIAMNLFVDHDELFQMCCETYTKCVKAFDEKLGFKFTTYVMNACYFNGNQWFKTQGREIGVVSRQSIDAFQLNDGEGIDRDANMFLADDQASPEDQAIARSETMEKLKALSSSGKKVIELMANPPPDLIAAFQASDMVKNRDEDDVPIKFIADWLQIPRSERQHIRSEIKKYFGVDLKCFPK
jgi:hypothetical protein